jgi:hypothetical protein
LSLNAHTVDPAAPSLESPASPASSDSNRSDQQQSQTPHPVIAESKGKSAGNAPQDETPVVAAIASTAAAGSHTNAFAQAQEVPVRASAADAAPSTPPPAQASEALRNSETALPQAAPAFRPAAQEISVRIARPDAPSVDVHVVEKAGQIQVSVRTPDQALQGSLRQELGTLVNSLERSGYRTETLAAQGTGQPGIQAAPGSGHSAFQNGRDQSEAGSPGNGKGSQSFQNPEGQQQRFHDRRSQKWIEELEKQS